MYSIYKYGKRENNWVDIIVAFENIKKFNVKGSFTLSVCAQMDTIDFNGAIYIRWRQTSKAKANAHCESTLTFDSRVFTLKSNLRSQVKILTSAKRYKICE